MNQSLTVSETKEFLLSIIGNSPMGIVVIDMKGYISVINKPAQTLLNLNENINYYLNKNILDVVKGISKLNENLNNCIHNGRETFTILESHFEEKYINITGQITLNGMMITFEDITSSVTARNALEEKSDELRKRNSELMEFNYLASHDLQEPLKTILGFSNLLQDESVELNEEAEFYISNISNVAEGMSQKISKLLAYSRLGRSGEKEEVSVDKVLDKLMSNLKAGLLDTDINIKRGSLPKVKAYEYELYSLFQNLVSNALKFQKANQKTEIFINCEDKGDFYEFVIQDNGIGIESKNFNKIFQVFQRLHNSDVYEGTGLGLAMCKKIVEAHGGELWVESELDKGSEFRFTIKK
jgi:signal transduction histidine kinase